MSLIKTSILNGAAVIIKMLTLLGLNKILAVYIGPSGYASIGQFQNIIQVIITFASGAINTGVTKYTAEYNDDVKHQRTIWGTAGVISLVSTLLVSLIIVVFSKKMAILFLKEESYASVFVWFSITLVFFVFNSLMLAVLNGKKEVTSYVIANIAGSIFSLIVVCIMTVALGLYGALVSLAIYQSLSFFVTLYLCYRLKWFRFGFFFGPINAKVAVDLSKYTFMALTSAICVPASHMFIRGYLGNSLGLDAAGHWEAMWRLSSAYLMMVTTTLGLYYLPRLSELKEKRELRKEIINGYKIILPVVIVCALIMYLLRENIVVYLFSVKFLAVSELFAFQLFGDTIRIASWLLGYLLIAKAYLTLYVVSEVIFTGLFAFLVPTLVSKFGFEGAAMAHAVTYIFHFSFIYVALKLKRVI